MRSEYITQLPAPPRSARSVVTDEMMMRMAFGDDDEDAD
jgi:hypothetical protein